MEQTTWDVQELKSYLTKEPWVVDIANNPDRTFDDIEKVVECFICKYYLMTPDELTTKDIADLFNVAKDNG